MRATSSGHAECARLLLEGGATVDAAGDNQHGATALTRAACDGLADMVRLLLEAGADANRRADGKTAGQGGTQEGDNLGPPGRGARRPRRCSRSGTRMATGR